MAMGDGNSNPADGIVFESAVPVLATSDYERARAFYRDQLRYAVVEEGGDPPLFGIFRRERSTIYVDGWKGSRAPRPEMWSVYIHVADVRALAAELGQRAIPLTRPVSETPYGMRECEITDPDGNVICFGEDMDRSA